jgi:ATP-dependent exoDNAse (exonuclease V) beta subunit
VGWGGYHPREPREKSKAELSVERRRELAKKFGTSTLEELRVIVAKSKVKVQRLPPAPHHDDTAEPFTPEVSEGPCQRHAAIHRRWRLTQLSELRAGGKAATPVVEEEHSLSAPEEEPYVSEPREPVRPTVRRRGRPPGKKAEKVDTCDHEKKLLAHRTPSTWAATTRRRRQRRRRRFAAKSTH